MALTSGLLSCFVWLKKVLFNLLSVSDHCITSVIIAWTTKKCFVHWVFLWSHHHHHHHQSLNCEGGCGTTDDFATSFLYFSLFSTAFWGLPNSRPVHSLMLSFHLLLCLPYEVKVLEFHCYNWHFILFQSVTAFWHHLWLMAISKISQLTLNFKLGQGLWSKNG